MNKIYKEFFDKLNRFNIDHCSWKSNHLLDDFLDGIGDVDLWVSIEHRDKFEKILNDFSFIKSIPFVNNFPHIDHYYYIQGPVILHLHVYYHIVTGESNDKNYILPFDSYLLDYSFHDRDIPTPNLGLQQTIYLTRFYLKIGSVYGFGLMLRDRNKYSGEFDYLFRGKPCPLYVNFISHGLQEKMLESYFSSSWISKVMVSLSLKKELKKYKRKGFLVNTFFKLKDLFLRLCNKIFLKKKKSFNRGILIAITGLDGSGKSTAVNFLFSYYNEHFDTTVIHMGRPNPTLLTFLFWGLFRCAEFLKHIKKSESQSVDSFKPKTRVSTIAAFRYALISFERLSLYKKAKQRVDQGYIVISDRYPSEQYGKMDSPRIFEDDRRSFIYQKLHNFEKNNYNLIKECDLSLKLSIPVDIAIDRNRRRNKSLKETDNEIISRYDVNSSVVPKSIYFHEIDASVSIPKVQEKLKNIIGDRLHYLNSNH